MRASLPELPTVEQVRAEKAKRSLAEFVRQAWHVVEPETPLIWNWHIDAICEHLEAVTRGDIRQLLINIPPGHMKSLIVAVFWPAWEWIEQPHLRNIFGSYAMDLAIRDSVRSRDLIKSQWFQESFVAGPYGPRWTLRHDQDAKSFFENTASGFRFCLSVGSKATGFRGDKIVCDDPLNAKDRHSQAARREHIDWWNRVMSSRLNDPRTGRRVIIMQRLHQDDLSGYVLERGGYEHLCLPSEFEPERSSATSVGWRDPRTERGELLFPELFTAEVIEVAKRDLGSTDYAGQHQQRPSAQEGQILKRKWWRFWVPKGRTDLPPVSEIAEDGSLIVYETVELPERLDEILQSWDMSFKDLKTSDFVAGGVIGRKGANKFVLDVVNARMDFEASCKAVQSLSSKWPRAIAKLIEDKANGPAIISALKAKVGGLIAVNPEGGKVARAYAVQPQLEAGNVYLPHPQLFSWVGPLIDQCADFPNAANDDLVDMLTQALIRMATPKSRSGMKAGGARPGVTGFKAA